MRPDVPNPVGLKPDLPFYPDPGEVPGGRSGSDGLPGSQDWPGRSGKLPGRSVLLPVRTNELPVGTVVLPVGSKKLPVGTIQLPVGSKKLPVGTIELPVGSEKFPVGTILLPTGSALAPVGSRKIRTGAGRISAACCRCRGWTRARRGRFPVRCSIRRCAPCCGRPVRPGRGGVRRGGRWCRRGCC